MAREPSGQFPKGNPGAGPARGAGRGSRGDGWGGEAASRARPAFTPETARLAIASRSDEDARIIREARAARLLDHLEELALTAEREETQVSATVAALNRLEGLPGQKIDMTSKGERVGYVIPAPAEAETVDAWQEQHRPH